MRRELRCERCRHRSFWLIGALKELAGGRPVPLAVVHQRSGNLWGNRIDALGSFELLVCASCAFAAFYVRDLDPTALPGETAAARTCADCERSVSPRAIPVEHRDEEDGRTSLPLRVLRQVWFWEGRFGVEVCPGCGRAWWRAREFRHVDPKRLRGARAATAATPCADCGEVEGFEVFEAQEDAPFALAWKQGFFRSSVGRFAQHICGGCGRTDWFARGLDQLRPDTPGVRKLEGRMELSQGPYR